MHNTCLNVYLLCLLCYVLYIHAGSLDVAFRCGGTTGVHTWLAPPTLGSPSTYDPIVHGFSMFGFGDRQVATCSVLCNLLAFCCMLFAPRDTFKEQWYELCLCGIALLLLCSFVLSVNFVLAESLSSLSSTFWVTALFLCQCLGGLSSLWYWCFCYCIVFDFCLTL